MIPIERIIQNKPHLKEILRLYEKVIEFQADVSPMLAGVVSIEDVKYPSELVDPIMKRFSVIFDVPAEGLTMLREAMKSGLIDFTRLPLGEVPSFSLPYHEDELKSILFILGRPFSIRLRELCNLDNIFWQEGRCPLCHAQPTMVSLADQGRRQLYCSFCQTKGYFKRTGCPICYNNDVSKINIITLEKEEAFRADMCGVCKTYLKSLESEVLLDLTVDIADLVSLPLDIIVQNRGFSRVAPNPIGLTRIA